MSRRAVSLSIAILLLLGGVAAGVILSVLHAPDYYVQAAVPPGEERTKQSKDCQNEFLNLAGRIDSGNGFYATFNSQQINSYLDEDFVRSGLAQLWLPPEISQPRVAFEPDKLRLAFRYGKGPWKAVVSVDLRVWVPAKERNVVALELQALHAGLLPISAQSLLEQISEAARQMHNLEVTWHRHNGNPVALIRFQADPDRPTLQLEKLELKEGVMIIRIRGQKTETAGLAAALPLGVLIAE